MLRLIKMTTYGTTLRARIKRKAIEVDCNWCIKLDPNRARKLAVWLLAAADELDGLPAAERPTEESARG